jgi:hypothetical protein
MHHLPLAIWMACKTKRVYNQACILKNLPNLLLGFKIDLGQEVWNCQLAFKFTNEFSVHKLEITAIPWFLPGLVYVSHHWGKDTKEKAVCVNPSKIKSSGKC